jgi:hypothetical protein
MGRRRDLTGMQFRRLTVLGPAGMLSRAVGSSVLCGEFAAHVRITLNKWY